MMVSMIERTYDVFHAEARKIEFAYSKKRMPDAPEFNIKVLSEDALSSSASAMRPFCRTKFKCFNMSFIVAFYFFHEGVVTIDHVTKFGQCSIILLPVCFRRHEEVGR